VDNGSLEKIVDEVKKKLYEIWREKLFSRHFKVDRKSSFRDIVTTIDIEIEEELKEFLGKLLSGAGYLGEETVGITNKEMMWVVDPIDGTTNFSRGTPHFCTSVALMKKDSVILGVVYDPNTRETFWAVNGKGSYLNGKKLKVSSTSELKEASIHTGLQYSSDTAYTRVVERISKAVKHSRALRITGSAALDLCYVASGRADVFWEEALNPWDVAAGILLVKEAGGDIQSCSGETFDIFAPDILAYNGNKKLIMEFTDKIL